MHATPEAPRRPKTAVSASSPSRWPRLAIGLGIAAACLVGLTACLAPLGGWLLQEESAPTDLVSHPPGLIGLDDSRWTLDQFAEARRHARQLRPDAERLVVFIHGMGPYPSKAFDHRELDALAESHRAAVLMVHWPAWRQNWLTLPRETALATGRALGPLWVAMRTDAATGGDRLPRRLLAHSMGAEVLRGVAAGEHARVADELLIAAPETDAAGHADWLSKLQLAPEIAIMVNRDDSMLRFSLAATGRARLGNVDLAADASSPDADSANRLSQSRLAEPLVAHVSYLQLDGLGDWHSLYASRQPPGLMNAIDHSLAEGDCKGGLRTLQLIAGEVRAGACRRSPREPS